MKITAELLADVFIFWPASNTNIIYTLSLTSNFPHLIQPCVLHTSVKCKWWRRGHAETSIKMFLAVKGSPLCCKKRYKCCALIRASRGVCTTSCPLRVASLSLKSHCVHVHALVCAFMFCLDSRMDSLDTLGTRNESFFFYGGNHKTLMS